MYNESQKENRCSEEITQEHSAKKDRFTDRPHLAELAENPFQFNQAKHVIGLLQKTKEFLINRFECLQKTQELEKEIQIRAKLMYADDSESSEENIIRLKATIAGIKKELDTVLDVLGRDNPAKYAGKAQLQKFYAEPFSWKSKISMLFGGKERVLQARIEKNEAVYDLLLIKARELVNRANSAVMTEAEKYTHKFGVYEFKKSIIEAESVIDINEKRNEIDAFFANAAIQKQLENITTEFNGNLQLAPNRCLENIKICYQPHYFPHHLSDDLGKKSTTHSGDLVKKHVETLQQKLSKDGKYAMTIEAEELITACNELGQKFQKFKEISDPTNKEEELEVKEIGRGRVLTHSASRSTIYETLKDGELMSVEAQARKKGTAKRTHGVNLVKENFMEDRNSLESHSLSFEVDAIYRNFVNLAEAPIVLVLDENHFLSKGYQFEERDGEHLFSPDYNNTDRSMPLAIDLKENPVVFMVREDEYATFCEFLLEKSAWKDMLAGLNKEERKAWIDKRVFCCSLTHKEVPERVRQALRELSTPPRKGYVGLTSALGHLKGGTVNLKKFTLAN